MCGIFACIHCSANESIDPALKADLIDKLKRRGPDHTGDVTVSVGDGVQLNMIGTLLHMRGANPTPQPLRGNPNFSSMGDAMTESGDNLFLWNGNIFDGDLQISAEENDTEKLFEELNRNSDVSTVLLTLSRIHGPWTFVYWQSCDNSLWFGRDVFGRRSLLWHVPVNGSTDALLLCSVGQYHPNKMPLGYWLEVPASCVFQLRCSSSGSVGGDLLCYPWMQGDGSFQTEAGIDEELSSLKTCLNVHKVTNLHLQVPFPPLNKTIPVQPHLQITPTSKSEAAVANEETTYTLSDRNVIEADTLREEIKLDSYVVKEDNISLPVSSVSASCVDWNTLAKQLIAVLKKAINSRVVRAPYLPSSSRKEAWDDSSVSLDHRRNKEASAGCQNQPLGLEPKMEYIRGKARIAVLFSGGVDSMLLAALLDKCLDPSEEIDLINVAFEQKSATHSQDSDMDTNFDVPDRVSSIDSLKELNPCRKWNLVLVNVTLTEVNTVRKERVSHLIFPLYTVLDDSIGCAFWFVARGQGSLYSGTSGASVSSPTRYKCQARTLFVGVGADEQLAGYSRHRTKFRESGWAGLLEEMEMDIKRLAKRNLGRDDRCIADHHREGQFPFLDEEVVAFLQQLPVHCKVDLHLPRGVGEKKLLREAAAMLGCHGASRLPKRAIQFGSRMAKLAGSSNSRVLGSDVCTRLLPDVLSMSCT